MLRFLDDREAACRAELDRLQAEAERIGDLLAACRQECDRLVTARGVLDELASVYPVDSGDVRRSELVAAVPASDAGPGAPRDDFEVFTEQVLAVLTQQGRPMRCRELVAELGSHATMARSNVERARHRLKRLCQAGQLEENTPGMFTVAYAAGATG